MAGSRMLRQVNKRKRFNIILSVREIEGLLEVLGRKEKTGLLPNDFLPALIKNYPEYLRFLGAFEACGASAWGLTGSGSSVFGLFYDQSGVGDLFREMAKWDNVRKIFYLE